jgi:hypothetical protein
MRILEISDEDRLWPELSKTNLNVDGIYEHAISVITMLGKIRSRKLRNNWLQTVVKSEEDLETIIGANLEDDESTRELKDKARRALKEIRHLRSKL